MDQEQFRNIPIGELQESELNPRKHYDEAALRDLIESVKARGVLTPILVRPLHDADTEPERFEILAGARRFRAAKAAGLDALPAVISELDDRAALEVMVIENLQRADIHPLEEAEGYKALIEGWTPLGQSPQQAYDVATLATKVGKSESYVYQRLKLADLIEPGKKAFLEDKLTPGHAILIARLQPPEQARALKAMFQGYDGPLSVRGLGTWIEEEIHLELGKVPWKLDDVVLVSRAGACDVCPKHTGANRALFHDVKQKDVCTDPTCYGLKLQAHFVQVEERLGKTGEKVVKISADYKAGKGIFGEEDWRRAEEGSCPDVMIGLVVEGGYSHGGELKRGRQVRVCINRKCKEHWQRESSSGYGSPGGKTPTQKAKERKERAITEARVKSLGLIAEKHTGTTLTPAQLFDITNALLGRTTFDSQKLFCKGMGVWPKDGKTGGFDFRKKAQAFIADASGTQVAGILLALAALPEYGRWGDGYYGKEDTARLYSIAKSVKLDVTKLERETIVSKAKVQTSAKAKKRSADGQTSKTTGKTKPAKAKAASA